MNTDLRRSKRFADFFPVTITAQNQSIESTFAEPYTARVINISRHGACLLLSMKTSDSSELLRSASSATNISIEIINSAQEPEQNMTLTGHPVWMDSFALDDLQAMKMGIEFTSDTLDQQPKGFPEDLVSDSADEIF